jgi:fructose-specific phosphotransferase system IIC component
VARASERAQRQVERRFPVRVRIAVPPAGLGRQLEIMHAWLDQTCGSEGWASAPAGLSGIVNDAIAFYFDDPAFAHAFVSRFCCGYRVETIGGAFAIRDDAPLPRRDARAHKTP